MLLGGIPHASQPRQPPLRSLRANRALAGCIAAHRLLYAWLHHDGAADLPAEAAAVLVAQVARRRDLPRRPAALRLASAASGAAAAGNDAGVGAGSRAHQPSFSLSLPVRRAALRL